MTDGHFTSHLLVPESQLTSQFQQEQPSPKIHIGIHDHDEQVPIAESSTSLPRLRPKSSHEIRSVLSPSPLFVEPSRRSKDDSHLDPTPVTPKRPNLSSRGLSLQMPPRDISSTSIANLTKRVPLSPKLDASTPYPSPSSVLPRRSRGLDFSRACTNLHHSTLAEQSSPDSSPTIGNRGMMIPSRKSLLNPLNIANLPDFPATGQVSLWSQAASTDKSVISSSLGSTNMMEFDSGASSSSDDDVMGHAEDEDTIHMTPQIYKAGNGTMNPFGPAIISSPGGDGIGGFSPDASKLMSFQRARLRKGRSRKNSSSASGHSSMYSPASGSPPLLKSIESSLAGVCFPRDPSKCAVGSRRESLSLGTNDLHIFDGEDSDEGTNARGNPTDSPITVTPISNLGDERRNVIRRAVTRRGNMLPKTKGFARIKAALHEEGTPIDTEVRREAEVIRQVRESDAEGDFVLQPSQPTTTACSPSLVPATSNQSDIFEYNSEDLMITSENSASSASRRSSSSTFAGPAIRTYNGLGFWNNFDDRMRTPPPGNVPRGSSSSISDEITVDTPLSSVQSSTPQPLLKSHYSIGSRSSTPQPFIASIDTTRKGNKRMRDDDFDPNYFKRRAVSPGMSLQNSPILPQSPLQRESGWWGAQPKTARETPGVQVIGERVSSGGSVSSGSGSVGPQKRVGFQGMNDTNDGLMNMSIE